MKETRNTILIDQNHPQQVDRLAAQRCLYSQAKRVLAAQLILTVAGAVVFAILAIIFERLRVWATFYGVSASLLDAAFLESRQKTLRQYAALIQEEFDCEVLRLEWPEWKASGKIDPEVIHAESCRYKKADPKFDDLKDWYEFEFTHLPHHLARLICQRASVGYDIGLRRSYRKWVAIIIVILCLGVFAFSLYSDVSMSKFILTVFAPLSPAILWGIREWKKQSEAIDSLDKLKKQADGLWKESLRSPDAQPDADSKARRLQDEILERRRNNPLIFDWLYIWQRDALEAQMRQMGTERIREAEKMLL